MARKSTTATPSLKSDSPAIFVSRLFGAPSVFKTASTAIGSVGEMSAPKSRHTMKGRSRPTPSSTIQMTPPMIAVDASRPSVASSAITSFCSARSLMSTCSAPAKSRKPSRPSINTLSKSMRASSSTTARSNPGKRLPAATTQSDATRPISIRPIVLGRPRKRWFR
jgi:hypothetical protein